jgi:acyl dehydratase
VPPNAKQRRGDLIEIELGWIFPASLRSQAATNDFSTLTAVEDCRIDVMDAVNFEDLPGLVGKEVGVSDWLQITQERVNQFADATGDHQWIHVDVERAKREIGGPIAHGFLVLSLIPLLASKLMPVNGVLRSINYGSDKVRFVSTVKVGAFVRLRRRVTGVEPKAGGMLIRNAVTIEIKGEEKPACVAETLGIVYRS